MARSRNLKPAFFLNEYLGTCDPFEALLFEGLWCLADRDGILENRPLKIKAQIFPYREEITTPVITRLVRNLSSNKFLTLYTVNGVDLILIHNFKKHQNPHKNEKANGHPKPDENQSDTKKPSNYRSAPVIDGTTRADSLLLNEESLNPIKDHPTGGAVAPIDQKKLKQLVWDLGTKLLGGTQNDRAFLGKQIANFGESKVLGILFQIEKNQPADPKSYLVAALKNSEPEKVKYVYSDS